jgi:hypothetical protein
MERNVGKKRKLGKKKGKKGGKKNENLKADIGLSVPCKHFMMALIAPLFPTHKLETALITIHM